MLNRFAPRIIMDIDSAAYGDSDLSESTLQAIRRGDAGAWTQLHERFERPLKRIASRGLYRDMRTKLGPSDLVQDTFMHAHRSAAGFRGVNLREMTAWIHRILRNRLARAIRDQRFAQKRALHREIRFEDMHRESRIAVDDRTPSQAAQVCEERELMDRAFTTLPEADRQLITDHYVTGLSFSELAIRTGRTEVAIRKHWSRAMGRWRCATEALANSRVGFSPKT